MRMPNEDHGGGSCCDQLRDQPDDGKTQQEKMMFMRIFSAGRVPETRRHGSIFPHVQPLDKSLPVSARNVAR